MLRSHVIRAVVRTKFFLGRRTMLGLMERVTLERASIKFLDRVASMSEI
jgi:hypothetical protein